MNVLENFSRVTTFVFDVDGVLTDGTVLLLDNGLQARKMHIKDGLALQMALKNGFRVLVVSGSYSEPVIKRMHYLGVTEVFCAVKNKKAFLEDYLQKEKIDWNHILFMGDDLPDIATIKCAGLGCCPADAVTEVKNASNYISPVKGGYGCVRDVIEKVLKLNNAWNFDVEVTSR
jgi:3-deoxy-D-manno-octulosonate 8-phosphate phosphatase (KDO 8-P phosphatase)